MVKPFFQTAHCQFHIHCPTCRWQTNEGHEWRIGISKHFTVPQIDFECPEGKPWETELKQAEPRLQVRRRSGGHTGRRRKSRGLGDTVAKLIRWVSFGKIQPCGGCKSRQARLNKLIPY